MLLVGDIMRNNALLRLTLLAILVSSIFISCDMPNDGMPTYDSFFDMNLVEINGSGHRILASGGCYHILLADSRIIFQNSNFTLFMMNYDGSNLVRLYEHVHWDDCSLSSNGEKVLLASYNSDGGNLYLMNSDGSNLLQLAPAKGSFVYPRISPNLDEIVFARNGSLATVNIDGTNLQYIRTKTDSTYCLFQRYVNENHILYYEYSDSVSIRHFDRTNHEDKSIATFRQITYPLEGKALQGGKFLFVVVNSIKILDIDSRQIVNVAQGFSASFSSDGTKIVYSDGKVIYAANSDGTNEQPIYTEQDADKWVSDPQLSPDGRFVIFRTIYSVRKN
jgi:hypothetical protein